MVPSIPRDSVSDLGGPVFIGTFNSEDGGIDRWGGGNWDSWNNDGGDGWGGDGGGWDINSSVDHASGTATACQTEINWSTADTAVAGTLLAIAVIGAIAGVVSILL
ncbi:hypothetical protein GGX14DRAFT_576187 [Mycena pura]|uniref:Uncharacterized protein n=1 Tax=Mycena pura TaxID=153505 RepID=A0AAD6Y3H6_9AGAR|nr:hypothetical protein GGX14DRAFT_576187 [Mycena pura]